MLTINENVVSRILLAHVPFSVINAMQALFYINEIWVWYLHRVPIKTVFCLFDFWKHLSKVTKNSPVIFVETCERWIGLYQMPLYFLYLLSGLLVLVYCIDLKLFIAL